MPLAIRSSKLGTMRPKEIIAALFYAVINFSKTIWLFTLSDLRSIVGPTTAFAILTVLSGPILTTNPPPQLLSVLTKIPQIVSWTWINLLPFTVDNQRQPKSIQEDAANKPWRPMPSRRLSQQAASNLVVYGYLLAIIGSFYLGGLTECLILMGLGVWYNTFGGADAHWSLKNFLNACGFISFNLGATKVAMEVQWSNNSFSSSAKYWFLVIGAVVLTSIQAQDMYDQEGDNIRGRKTLPLAVGDRSARWTIALSVGFWSFFCPMFWEISITCRAISIFFGATIAFRTLSKVSVLEDKKTFHLWNLWLIMLYLMPVVERIDL